jgi:hypothetical protein
MKFNKHNDSLVFKLRIFIHFDTVIYLKSLQWLAPQKCPTTVRRILFVIGRLCVTPFPHCKGVFTLIRARVRLSEIPLVSQYPLQLEFDRVFTISGDKHVIEFEIRTQHRWLHLR